MYFIHVFFAQTFNFSYDFKGLTLSKGRSSPEGAFRFKAVVIFGPGDQVRKDVEVDIIFCHPNRAIKSVYDVEILGSLRQITVITKDSDNDPLDSKRPAIVAINDSVFSSFYASDITSDEKEEVLQYLQTKLNLSRFVPPRVSL